MPGAQKEKKTVPHPTSSHFRPYGSVSPRKPSSSHSTYRGIPPYLSPFENTHPALWRCSSKQYKPRPRRPLFKRSEACGILEVEKATNIANCCTSDSSLLQPPFQHRRPPVVTSPQVDNSRSVPQHRDCLTWGQKVDLALIFDQF